MTLAFWITAVVAVITGLNVIFQKNPIYSALFLVANFFCLAVFYLLLSAEFLAAVQIIVYAGAIMVLFLFVITMLSPGREDARNDPLAIYRIPAIIGGIGLAIGMSILLAGNALQGAMDTTGITIDEHCTVPPTAEHTGGGLGCVSTIGDRLFSTYLFPFEITSFLLLLAMLGAVILAKRKIS